MKYYTYSLKQESAQKSNIKWLTQSTFFNAYLNLLSQNILQKSNYKKMKQGCFMLTFNGNFLINFPKSHNGIFKAYVNYFLSNFYLSPNDSPSKTMNYFYISSKKPFSFSRYSIFFISIFISFPSVSHCVRGWSKINLKVYDIINCLNKNLITHFVWYLGK